MKRGNLATLRMKNMLRGGAATDVSRYSCRIVRFDKKEECIYLILLDGKLEKLSLDAIYYCETQDGEEVISCTGRISERYCSPEGKTVRFKIENGFYKINIKCVDKQKA